MTALRKYDRRVDEVESLLCVGLDPDMEKIPPNYRSKSLPQLEFNKYIIEETHSSTAAYKLNMAFYESRGAAGIAELEQTVSYLRQNFPDIFIICDAKRGDIANTNAQYAAAIFDGFGFDAVTVNPYMGAMSLSPMINYEDKVIIVVCRSVNPGADEIQSFEVHGEPLWRRIASNVARDWNTHGNCMLVIGATNRREMRCAREIAGEMTFLVPGVGAQGGDLEAAVTGGLNSEGKGLMIVAARSVCFSDSPKIAAAEMKDQINRLRK